MSRRPNPVLAVQSSLTDRDLQLLDWLYDHRVLTTAQIAHALFPSLTFCQRRLLRLTDLQAVDRFRPQRAYGGTYPYHYLLDRLGHEIVAAQRGEDLPRPSVARAHRQHLTSRANLPHLIGTNEVFIQLAGYARTHPEAALLRWWPPGQAVRPVAVDQARDLAAAFAAEHRVRPDGAGVWRDRGRTVPFHLEYDLATEPLGTLVDKIERYDQLGRATGRPWPVLVWVPTSTRELHLHQQLARRRADLLVTVATAAADRVAAAGRSLAEEVWWPYAEGGRIRLGALRYDGPDPLTADGVQR